MIRTWTLLVALVTLIRAGTYAAPANDPLYKLPPAAAGEAVQQITQEIISLEAAHNGMLPHTNGSNSTLQFLSRRERSASKTIWEILHKCDGNATFTTMWCQTEPVECSDVRLLRASLQGDVPAVERTLSAGVNVTVCDVTPLIVAVVGGHLDMVRALLSSGDNAKEQTRAADDHGRTPLHFAAILRLLGIARLLVAAGAHVSAADTNLHTPLHAATYGAHGPFVKFLLEKGADVNARAKDDFTPLDVAARRGDVDVIEDLLSAGADVEAKTTLGYTALMYAARAERPAIVRLLLAHGADVNASTMSGRTALHRAAINRNSEIVEALLEAGADAGARDDEGRTPLFYASTDDVRRALERQRWRWNVGDSAHRHI